MESIPRNVPLTPGPNRRQRGLIYRLLQLLPGQEGTSTSIVWGGVQGNRRNFLIRWRKGDVTPRTSRPGSWSSRRRRPVPRRSRPGDVDVEDVFRVRVHDHAVGSDCAFGDARSLAQHLLRHLRLAAELDGPASGLAACLWSCGSGRRRRRSREAWGGVVSRTPGRPERPPQASGLPHTLVRGVKSGRGKPIRVLAPGKTGPQRGNSWHWTF